MPKEKEKLPLFQSTTFLSFLVGAIYLITAVFEGNHVDPFGTTEGSQFLTMMAPIRPYYFEQPLQQTLYAIDKGKIIS